MDWTSLSKPKSEDDPLGLNKPTIEEKVEAIVTAPPDDEEVKLLQDHMAKIEKDYDGVSNIPVNHLYYTLRARIDQIRSK